MWVFDAPWCCSRQQQQIQILNHIVRTQLAPQQQLAVTLHLGSLGKLAFPQRCSCNQQQLSYMV